MVPRRRGGRLGGRDVSNLEETLSQPSGAHPEPGLVAGCALGGRYRIEELLGRGGMGEVWRAYDLKLRTEVALKALNRTRRSDEQFRELLVREVRAARQINSSNVCRVFELFEADGLELASMECVDGVTLLEILRDRSPLDLREAQEIATQLLAGVHDIHSSGLVHGDLKPSNIMVTRSGRVVIMDFGLATAREEASSSTIAGTPAYMAPEQGSGRPVDSRSDIFSVGMILAEMVNPDGVKHRAVQQKLWDGIRSEHSRLPRTPWSPVLAKALSSDPGERWSTAEEFLRMLQEATLRLESSEFSNPYPGLASFTEENVDYFFGRQVEVEQMWKKLRTPSIQALTGPSGSGKSSFLRAGLLPCAGKGWRTIMTTPGTRPFLNLARTLPSELRTGCDERRLQEPDTTIQLFAEWRRRGQQCLLIIDQFEELFTQNSEETQRAFAAILGRLPLEADIHVLLSVRDDFLIRCREHESLCPMFSDLTVMPPLSGDALRRSIVQPALKCGYHFEDDALVEELVREVEGERGALPLMAFAVARLWEKRDREKGLVTQQAYEEIGGVTGALIQHAETALERIGTGHIRIVRELFRNLVTAQGTRASRERGELLSLFPDEERHDVQNALDMLVDARLLTSYELKDADTLDGTSTGQHLEIVHESLLSKWPRLVRWQTQDAEGAQLRDELRQASRLWQQHGRDDDYLWTGTAFSELRVWRERYTGSLTELEEQFARAVVSAAGRRRRRISVAVTAAFLILLSAIVLIGSYWSSAEAARRRAELETRRSEASKLAALGRVELTDHPAATLAYALASLELEDNRATRLLALEALWKGPPPLQLGLPGAGRVAISPDGEWLAIGTENGKLTLISRDGRTRKATQAHDNIIFSVCFMGSDRIVTSIVDDIFVASGDIVRVWSVPDLELLGTLTVNEPTHVFASLATTPTDPQLMTGTPRVGGWQIRRWNPPSQSRPEWAEIGTGTVLGMTSISNSDHDLVFSEGGTLFTIPLAEIGQTSPRRLASYEQFIHWIRVTPDGRRLVVIETAGLHVWTLIPEPAELWSKTVDFSRFGVARGGALSPDGRWFAFALADERVILFDLEQTPAAEPRIMSRGEVSQGTHVTFSPDSRWLVSSDLEGAAFWPLNQRHPAVFQLKGQRVLDVAADRQGTWIGGVGLSAPTFWSILTDSPVNDMDFETELGITLESSPDGRFIAVGSGNQGGELTLFDRKLGRSTVSRLFKHDIVTSLAFDGAGRYLFAGSGYGNQNNAVIAGIDLEGGETRTLVPGHGRTITDLAVLPDGRLLESSLAGVATWDLNTGRRSILSDRPAITAQQIPGSDRLLMIEVPEDWKGPIIKGRAGGTLRILSSEGRRLDHEGVVDTRSIWSILPTPDGRALITGDDSGAIRVGGLDGRAPHLLLGHRKAVRALDMPAKGSWFVSGGGDSTVRVWPMPDLDATPFHELPHEELLAKLRKLTNMRAVRDEVNPSGYRLELAPFPGWEAVPEW